MEDRVRNTSANSTYKKLAVQCSADAFVVNQTLVLRINICGENRQLLVAAKRCGQLGLPRGERRQSRQNFA